MRKRFVLFLLVAVVLLGGLLSVAVPVASARAAFRPDPGMYCTNAECDGLDPYATGCAGVGASYRMLDEVPVLLRGKSVGWLQLWGSQTCGTRWAAYTCVSACALVEIHVHWLFWQDWPVAVADHSCHTEQVYMPTTLAFASLTFTIGGAASLSTNTY